MEERLRRTIRDVPDFPKAGIVFKDITPILSDPALFRETVEALVAPFRGDRVSKVLGIESRGFLFGPLLAFQLGAGFVPARKPGKLPRETVRETYALEYGSDCLEIHRDAFREGERVLVVDDLLPRGGRPRPRRAWRNGSGRRWWGSPSSSSWDSWEAGRSCRAGGYTA